AFILRIFIPPEAVALPADGNEVHGTIVIHIDGPFAAIGNEFAGDFHSAVLVTFPLATLWAGIFVPICAADDIEFAVAIHVDEGDTFGVIGAQTVRGKVDFGNVVGAVA